MQFTESNKGSTIMRATQGIEFKPLIKTLVERNAVGMIVAPAKAKKSMLALEGLAEFTNPGELPARRGQK